MTRLILGSRIFQPLSEVMAESGDESFGTSAIARQAERLGATRRPLTASRRELLESIEGGGDVTLYVARDPATKQPTTGMQMLQRWLNEKGIPFTVVNSPFPGKVCAAITELAEAVAKAQNGDTRKRQMMVNRALERATTVTDLRDRYDEDLEEGFWYGLEDKALTDKWMAWLRIRDALDDALKAAEVVLA